MLLHWAYVCTHISLYKHTFKGEIHARVTHMMHKFRVLLGSQVILTEVMYPACTGLTLLPEDRAAPWPAEGTVIGDKDSQRAQLGPYVIN